MSPKIHLLVAVAFAILSPVALFYAYLFESVLEPSLPVIPLAMALTGLMSAGAAGWNLSEMFQELEA